jgi:hypothetical protein
MSRSEWGAAWCTTIRTLPVAVSDVYSNPQPAQHKSAERRHDSVDLWYLFACLQEKQAERIQQEESATHLESGIPPAQVEVVRSCSLAWNPITPVKDLTCWHGRGQRQWLLSCSSLLWSNTIHSRFLSISLGSQLPHEEQNFKYCSDVSDVPVQRVSSGLANTI